MAAAYSALVNYGLLVEPTLVKRILEPEGQPLFAHEAKIRQAIAPDLAAQMVHLLRQAIDRGTGRQVCNLGFKRPAAGKTGTTNENTDAWFTGFTPDMVASVWIGFDDRRDHRLVELQGRQITGGSGAAPIWTDFMMTVNTKRPWRDFANNDNLRLHRVHPLTGIEDHASDGSGIAPFIVALRRDEQPNSTPRVDSLTTQRTTNGQE